MKVLIVKTSSMGDIIHTLPALTDAAKVYPDIRFDWVVEENFSEIPKWHKNVDKVIPVAIRRWRKNIFKTLKNGEWSAYKADLKKENYDLIIDAQGLLKSAFLAAKVAKGTRYGLDKESAKEPLASFFYDHTINVSKNLHAVERVRLLFAAALNYSISEEMGDFAIKRHFSTHQLEKSTPYLVFQHSTTRFDKHWPETYWVSLIEKAGAEGWKIKLPWGSPKERERAERFAHNAPHVEVLPKLSLSEVAHVLAEANACVSVDTGLSHLAAALDTPNVILFGSTDPGLVGGYGQHQLCLEAKNYPAINTQIEPAIFAPLTPEIAWDALNSLLDKTNNQEA